MTMENLTNEEFLKLKRWVATGAAPKDVITRKLITAYETQAGVIAATQLEVEKNWAGGNCALAVVIERIIREAETALRNKPASIDAKVCDECGIRTAFEAPDRKSTRLNSSHSQISYAVFCLKKKKK